MLSVCGIGEKVTRYNMASITKIVKNYGGNIVHYGLYEGSRMNFQNILARMYFAFLFHTFSGAIDFSGYVYGRKYIKIGKNFNAGRFFRLEAIQIKEQSDPNIIIKNNVSISDYCHIGAVNHIEIGNYVLFGSKCYVTDHNHGIYSGNEMQSDPDIPPSERTLTCDKDVIIEDNVWVGDNVTILPGVTIGKGAIIGSNAVVSKNIPPYSIAVGMPARVIKLWNKDKKVWQSI